MYVAQRNALNSALLDWKCNKFQRKVCKIYEITLIKIYREEKRTMHFF